MPRLTPQLIDEAVERSNPLYEREIILRGLKFSIIENLGIGLDAYDSYDMCDNDITKFDGFPMLKKAAYFYCNNNRISFIAGDLHIKLPHLKEVSLINNDIRSFTDIKRLEKCKGLKVLSLTRNPVTVQDNYRAFVIYTLPSLRFLDFNRIREKERVDAKKFFEETEVGMDLLRTVVAQVKEEKDTIDSFGRGLKYNFLSETHDSHPKKAEAKKWRKLIFSREGVIHANFWSLF